MTIPYTRSTICDPDYLKLAIFRHAETMEATRKMFNEIEADVLADFGIKVKRDETFIRVQPDGKQFWVFEYSGQDAVVLYYLNFESWRKYIRRLDVKQYYTMGKAQLFELQSLVSGGNTGRRNFGTDRSRTRKKTDKRDAGGLSFHVGSPKSDYRINVSLRGDETGYVEFQYKDVKVTKAQDKQAFHVRNGANEQDAWRDLLEYLWREGQGDLVGITGLEWRYLEAVMNGMLPDCDNDLERDLARLEAKAKQLPAEGAAALCATLLSHFRFKQEDLFTRPEGE